MEIKQHNLEQPRVIKRDIGKYHETNENENTAHQNLWDVAKAVLRVKFSVINAHGRKEGP